MNTGDLFCNMADGRRICYRSHGPDGGETLILVVGLGLQLTYWPQALIDGLVEAGLRVVVLDNRDAGQSSFTDAEPPSTFQQLLRRPTRGYDLGHMASDVVGLMDALSIASAHVMGMSMGGMIAQTLAVTSPTQGAAHLPMKPSRQGRPARSARRYTPALQERMENTRSIRSRVSRMAHTCV